MAAVQLCAQNAPEIAAASPLLGSAVVAAVGAGAYPDLVRASRRMVEISGQVDPDPARHEAYEYYVRAYQRTYVQLKELMQDMSQTVAG